MFYLSTLTLTLPLLVLAVGRTPSPAWPRNCTFSTYERVYPRADYYSTQQVTSHSECLEVCGEDEVCGMTWYDLADGECRLFQVSARMWQKVTAFPGDALMFSDGYWRTASKECDGVVTSPGCDVYPVQYDRSAPAEAYRFTYVSTSTPHQLTPSHCHRYCALYGECRSVWYFVTAAGLSYCSFYNITLTELVVTGAASDIDSNRNTADYPEYITYERYCGDNPYDPASNLGPRVTLQGLCKPGFQPHNNKCQRCGENEVKKESGNHTCEPCPSRWITNTDRTQCVTCSAGMELVGPSCVRCSPGTYKRHHGVSGCENCSEGSTTRGNERTKCELCLEGFGLKAVDSGGNAVCEACANNTYSNETSAGSCQICSHTDRVVKANTPGNTQCEPVNGTGNYSVSHSSISPHSLLLILLPVGAGMIVIGNVAVLCVVRRSLYQRCRRHTSMKPGSELRSRRLPTPPGSVVEVCGYQRVEYTADGYVQPAGGAGYEEMGGVGYEEMGGEYTDLQQLGYNQHGRYVERDSYILPHPHISTTTWSGASPGCRISRHLADQYL